MWNAYAELRRSVCGDHPVGPDHVVAWLDLYGLRRPRERELVWRVVRKLDDWTMQRRAEELERRRKDSERSRNKHRSRQVNRGEG